MARGDGEGRGPAGAHPVDGFGVVRPGLPLRYEHAPAPARRSEEEQLTQEEGDEGLMTSYSARQCSAPAHVAFMRLTLGHSARMCRRPAAPLDFR
ncbi:hypothetical protein SCWH03_38490 [Streptomyces pacificus]|uniref:Uncharacterized protein n=1 Tax=Streptomyces pacificus TaxID=2705029 RepID=A0A6A0AZ51_9ACTN|nr:hypothetical protein SCWH03_38490 [Streptomyces pacificus]